MTKEFHMTTEENIFYAKRNVVDSIWKEANIEGIAVTFPDTREIFEGRPISSISVDETVAINNLKHGWQFVFDTVDVPVDLMYIRQVNQLVGAGIVFASGELRMADVSIGGTSWKPEIPDYDEAKSAIDDIYNHEPGQNRALEMFAYLCRSQLFNDGNKRTAQLVANKMLIEDGAGILAIPIEEKRRFEELLIEFYETGDSSTLCSFLSVSAIDGYDNPLFESNRVALAREKAASLNAKRGSGRQPGKGKEDLEL